jgi:hypothetical protein
MQVLRPLLFSTDFRKNFPISKLHENPHYRIHAKYVYFMDRAATDKLLLLHNQQSFLSVDTAQAPANHQKFSASFA